MFHWTNHIDVVVGTLSFLPTFRRVLAGRWTVRMDPRMKFITYACWLSPFVSG
jgi:hypothetical protein